MYVNKTHSCVVSWHLLLDLALAVADLGRLVRDHDHVHVVIGSLRNVNVNLALFKVVAIS